MKCDHVARRLRFVMAILSAVVCAGAPGCGNVVDWGNLFGENQRQSRATRRVTSEPQPYLVTEPADDPDATSAESLEARINDYVDFYRERDRLPKEAPVTELAAANDLSGSAESYISESGMSANNAPVLVDDAAHQVPEFIARVETDPASQTSKSIPTNGADREAADPAREQEAPVLLSVSVEPDLLSGPTMTPVLTPSGNAEPNRGARVAMRTSGNDIDAVVERLQARVAERPNDLASQFRLKLLYLVQGREQEALAPPQGLADDIASLIRTVAEALVATQRAFLDLQTRHWPPCWRWRTSCGRTLTWRSGRWSCAGGWNHSGSTRPSNRRPLRLELRYPPSSISSSVTFRAPKTNRVSLRRGFRSGSSCWMRRAGGSGNGRTARLWTCAAIVAAISFWRRSFIFPPRRLRGLTGCAWKSKT